jgi:hypothetical protein
VATEVERFEGFGMHQRLIVEEIFSPRRETLVLIRAGTASRRCSRRGAAVAASQAGRPDRGGGGVARPGGDSVDIVRGFAQHPEIAELVETTRRETRTAGGWLKVIAADGPRQHGLILDLAICDELHAHGRRDLYDALRTSMLKRPGARMVTISTAAPCLTRRWGS